MPINYSKWDKLELSDDDDFEGHPNVDKGTEVRLRQAEIHRQRKDRKVKINHLKGEIAILETAAKSLTSIISTQLNTDSIMRALTMLRSELAETANQLQSETWKEANTNRDYRWGPYEPDSMIVEIHPFGPGIDKILNSIQAKINNGDSNDESIIKDAKQMVEKEVTLIFRRKDLLLKGVEELQKQEDAKLTSENMFKEGFSKTIISKEADETPIKSKGKQSIEVIHNPSSSTSNTPTAHASTSNSDGSEGNAADEISLSVLKSSNPTEGDEDEDSYLTNPIVAAFVGISPMEESYRYLMKHSDIVNVNNSDEVLAEAMRLEMAGKNTPAKQCVQQSLILQYCANLGKDGVRLFFERMKNTTHGARKLYTDDVEKTYQRIANRVKEMAKEAEEKEKAEAAARIAAAEQPDGSYALPDLEDASEEYKTKAQVFKDLPRKFQRALLSQDADEINRAMSTMPQGELDDMISKCVKCGLLDMEVEGAEDELIQEAEQ
ncbi:hypothetical protein SeMB42_g05865 [Synchytrium endobioticum]|uniref:Hsp90 chaperone protein kinase-targeting subunit n=1 Tax=Synchytrium endobioticum TaxID=286115 RepID=A0A507CNZ4_9FUNG|nr:hypothetical protein SeMB42_g05865 [Synchytrium endobioticum]TPX47262.1 hypothetical protein SeLEV6574_g02759 [Synchytrium endobioticum]